MLWSKIDVATDIRTYTRPYNFIAMPELEWLRSMSPGASNKQCVGRALELSRDVPLVISFIKPARWKPKDLSDQDVEMLDMLLDHAPRWKVAYLDASNGGALIFDKLQRLRGRVPMLESISINDNFAFDDGSTYPDDVLSVVPRLCKVAIRNSLGELLFPWQQIQRLILNGLHDMSYLLHVLRSVKNVEHPTICNCSATTDVNTILPAVHTLDLLSNSNTLYFPSLIASFVCADAGSSHKVSRDATPS